MQFFPPFLDRENVVLVDFTTAAIFGLLCVTAKYAVMVSVPRPIWEIKHTEKNTKQYMLHVWGQAVIARTIEI